MWYYCQGEKHARSMGDASEFMLDINVIRNVMPTNWRHTIEWQKMAISEYFTAYTRDYLYNRRYWLPRGNYPNDTFVFLGYLFAPREAQSKYGQRFVNFSPAVSSKAAQRMCHEMRSWRFHRRSDKSLEDLSRISNSILRGWINYYGQYYKSALCRVFSVLNSILIRWAMRKYKRFRTHQRRAADWLRRIACRQPWLFAHWEKGFRP